MVLQFSRGKNSLSGFLPACGFCKRSMARVFLCTTWLPISSPSSGSWRYLTRQDLRWLFVPGLGNSLLPAPATAGGRFRSRLRAAFSGRVYQHSSHAFGIGGYSQNPSAQFKIDEVIYSLPTYSAIVLSENFPNLCLHPSKKVTQHHFERLYQSVYGFIFIMLGII